MQTEGKKQSLATFPALSGYMFPRACRWLHVFGPSSDWFIAVLIDFSFTRKRKQINRIETFSRPSK